MELAPDILAVRARAAHSTATMGKGLMDEDVGNTRLGYRVLVTCGCSRSACACVGLICDGVNRVVLEQAQNASQAQRAFPWESHRDPGFSDNCYFVFAFLAF